MSAAPRYEGREVPMRIHQALHGVGKGHQLLITSADLTREEHWLMEQLSDLCGQLDADEDFEHFHAGYPCGRWVVVARTWLDRDAPRKGTVYTHSLLFDPTDLARVDDLGRLAPLFRKPRKGEDRAGWGVALDQDLPDAPALGAEPSVVLRSLAAMFLVEARPLLWNEHSSAEDAARLSWMALPPAKRVTWSWCTRALHPRYIDNKPMAWMAPGPNARSAFLPLRAPTVGERLPPAMEQAAKAMGLDGVDGAALAAIWPELPADLPPSRLRLVTRLARMRGRADWQGTLACLDADEALDLANTPAVTADVDRALALLGGPPPADRSLVDLSALLARRPWTRATARTEALADLTRETLAARIPRMNLDDEKALGALIRAVQGTPLAQPIQEGARRGMLAAPYDVQRRVRELLMGV